MCSANFFEKVNVYAFIIPQPRRLTKYGHKNAKNMP